MSEKPLTVDIDADGRDIARAGANVTGTDTGEGAWWRLLRVASEREGIYQRLRSGKRRIGSLCEGTRADACRCRSPIDQRSPIVLCCALCAAPQNTPSCMRLRSTATTDAYTLCIASCIWCITVVRQELAGDTRRGAVAVNRRLLKRRRFHGRTDQAVGPACEGDNAYTLLEIRSPEVCSQLPPALAPP